MTRLLAALEAGAVPLAVGAAAFTLAVGLPSGDPDMWWHLASGRWMVEHGDGLRVDVFSSTATGEPYALGQWLGDVVLYIAYASGSWTGVALLRAALVAAAAFSVTRLALRAAPAGVAVPLAALALLLSKPTWTDRPQLFTLALFPLVLDLCFAARAGSRAALVASVAVIAVWANLHGGYALGIGVLWIFAVEAVLDRRPSLAPLSAAVAATAIVSFEPGALSLLRAIGHVAGSTVRIVEESPVDPLTPFGALFALFVGATLALLMLRGGSLLGALVLVPTLVLALSAQRHIPLFGFAAVPFLAGPLGLVVSDVRTTVSRASIARGFGRGGGTFGRGGGISDAARARSSERGGGSPEAMYVFRHQDADERHRIGDDRHLIGDERHQVDDETHTAVKDHPGAAVGQRASPNARTGASSARASASRSHLPVALAAALWLGAIASLATTAPGPDLSTYPIGAVAALEASTGVLLNEYDWGGWLIWAVPSRPVFVDGRLYPFAGNGVMRAYQDAVHVLPAWRAVIERWNVRQALLRPDRALVQALRDEGWTVRGHDARFVLLERPR